MLFKSYSNQISADSFSKHLCTIYYFVFVLYYFSGQPFISIHFIAAVLKDRLWKKMWTYLEQILTRPILVAVIVPPGP